MRFLKGCLLLLILPIFAFTSIHKFYVSVTNVNYSEKYSAIQITSRIFIDDLEAVLKERYDLEANLATDKELDIAATYIQKYLKEKFIVEIDGEAVAYQFLGKKYDNDLVIFYIEIADIDLQKIKSITIQNKVLTDIFDNQRNILHFKMNDTKKSFVLTRDSDKGMLKL